MSEVKPKPRGMKGIVGWRCFIAASAGSCAATATMWMQPMLIRYLVVDKGLNEAISGLLLTAEMGATALGSLALARLVARKHAQIVALSGMTLALFASFVTLYLNNYSALLVARSVVGLGCGATILINNIVAANFPDPEKAYARMGCVNLLFGYLLVTLFAHIGSFWSTATPYSVLLLAFLLLLPLMAILPKFREFDIAGEARAIGDSQTLGRTVGIHTLLLSAVTFAIVVSSGMLWSLYGLIGDRSHLSTAVVNSAIEASIFTGFVGMILCAVVGSSLGRIGPFCLSLLLMTGAIVTLTSHPSAVAFEVAVCVNVATIYFIIPYLSGAAVAVDGSGRAASYVASAFFIGNSASPFIAGALLTTQGIEFIGRLIVVLAIGSAVIYIYVVRATPAKLASVAQS
jgi:MFS family permease